MGKVVVDVGVVLDFAYIYPLTHTSRGKLSASNRAPAQLQPYLEQRLYRAPLALVLARYNHTTHTNMSSGFGLTGGTSTRAKERGESAENRARTEPDSPTQHWHSTLTTPSRATRSLTMLSLLAGRASLLRRQHLDR